MTTTNRRADRRADRRAFAALLAGAAVALGLVGCGSGQITQTANQAPAVPGANVTVGAIALRDLQIAYPGPNGYPAGGNAPLIVRVFNGGAKPVKLTGVTATGAARTVALSGGALPAPAPTPTATLTSTGTPTPTGSASASASASVAPSSAAPTTPSAPPSAAAGQESFSIEIPAQGYVLLVPGSGPYLQLVGLTSALTPGVNVDVTFTFDDGSRAIATLPFAPAPNPVRGTPVPGEKKEE